MNDIHGDIPSHALLSQWLNGLRIQHIAHSRAAVRFHRRGRLLGIPVVVLTTLVGTGIFATLDSAPGTGWKVFAGLLSALAAVLAGLQTFLGYPELAQSHKLAAQRYGSLRREVEEIRARGGSSDDFLTSIRERWDQLDEQSPTTPQEFHELAAAEVRGPRT